MRRLLIAASLLLAGLASAESVQTVLTPDSTLYAIEGAGELPLLQLTVRNGLESESLIVPGTEDDAKETHPRLLWDKPAETLYVVWHRAGDDGDDIRLATLKGGEWSEPLTIAGCTSAKRGGLQVVLTHAAAELEGAAPTTLVHVAWWKVAGDEQTPEYALLAFEAGLPVSTAVEGLAELAGLREAESSGELEPDVDVLHPPLAMTRKGEEVEIVFGAPDSTSLTRIRLLPRKAVGHARLWKPSRAMARNLPKAGLVSSNGAPVQGFITNGRVVLYTPDQNFRFVVYEKGAWTPTRMIKLDEKLSGDELLEHLRRAVEEQETEDDGSTNE